MELAADPDAVYAKTVEIDLAELVPLAARPHSPDNIGTVRELSGLPVDQVCIGSCTNSSYRELATVAQILRGRVVHPRVSFIVTPGSRQVLENLARDGYLADLLCAGARIMESACGFCIGNSQSPGSKGVSLRTSNRNFYGRSGTKDAEVYLVSPETAAAAVVKGIFTDPRDLGMDYPAVDMPETFSVDDCMILRTGAPGKSRRPGDHPGAQHRRSAAERTHARAPPRRGDHQGGRQDHDGSHHAGRGPDEVPLQHPPVCRFRL